MSARARSRARRRSIRAWLTATLTADAAVVKGDFFAVVFAPGNTPNFQLINGAGVGDMRFPYSLSNTGAWAKNAATLPGLAVEYSDASFAYMPGTFPASAITVHTVDSGTDPDEIALKFTPAAPIRVSGVWLFSDFITADSDFDIVIYEGTSALETLRVQGLYSASATDGGPHLFMLDTALELDAGTAYYAAIKPATTNDFVLYSFDVASAPILDQMSGGQAFHYAQRVDAGAWSATTTRRPVMGLIIDGIDDGAGGGGGGIGGRVIGAGT
jgi:hypothetical protein